MSVRVLASARTALETNRGTAVTPATRLLYFTEASHTQDVPTIEPVDSRGGFTRLYRAYPGVERNTVDLSGYVNYDDFAMIGLLAVGSVTAAAVQAGTSYAWTFTPVGTADTQRSVTMEFAYADLLSTVGWRVPGLVADELTIKWDKEQPTTYQAKLVTAKGATQITAFTGTLSDRSEVTATGPTWSAYLDTTTIGTTLDPRVLKAELSVKNGYKVRDGADGTAVGIEVVKTELRDVSLKLTRYFNDKTELDAYIAKTTRLIRLKSVGGTFGGGTAVYTHQVDFAGVASDHKTVESDGMIYADITYSGIAHAQVNGTADYSIYVINSLSALT